MTTTENVAVLGRDPFYIRVKVFSDELIARLDPSTVSDRALRWQPSADSDGWFFEIEPGMQRLMHAPAIPLSDLYEKDDNVRNLVLSGTNPYPDLPEETYLVIKLLDVDQADLTAQRFDLTDPAPLNIPIRDNAAFIKLSIRLDRQGIWRPVDVRLTPQLRRIDLTPTERFVEPKKFVPAAPVANAPAITPQLSQAIGNGEWLDLAPEEERLGLVKLLAASESATISRRASTLEADLKVLTRRLDEIQSVNRGANEDLVELVSNGRDDIADVLADLQNLRRSIGRLGESLRRSLTIPTEDGGTAVPALLNQPRVPSPDAWRSAVVDRGMEALEHGGLFAAFASVWAYSHLLDKGLLSEELADNVARLYPDLAASAFLLAYGAQPIPQRARRIASRMFKMGHLTAARELIARAPEESVTPFVGELRLATHLATEGIKIPPRRKRRRGAAVDDLAYVASSSLPYSIAGYTTRTQQLLSALIGEGIKLTCYTRPGYPWDRPLLLQGRPEVETHYEVDGVRYVLSRVEGVETEPEGFIDRMADALTEQFTKRRPRVVQAASNNRNALPALIAARRAGIPFIYEVRGLWELTAASRIEGWENTERFELDRRLELLIANEADVVLTITGAVAAELSAGGVDRKRIDLLTNAVNIHTFVPIKRNEALAEQLGIADTDFVMVYAGSLVNYEGIDDMIKAVAILRSRDVPARMLIVGDGANRGELEEIARTSEVTDAVTFVGRVGPTEVNSYYSLADVVPVTRKPFRVCEVVSPLKPFEAMAMEKVVLLSDLEALREIVIDGERGRLCKPADPEDLARVLEELYRDPAERERLGKAGRDWVVNHRSWEAHARTLRKLYKKFA